MSDTPIPENSLVLYHLRPARVRETGLKLTIELDGETAKVRPKDVLLLHPGPLRSLSELKPVNGDVQTAWEMLAGTSTNLPELAELVYEKFTPATAWAAWQLVTDGLYFRGAPDEIIAVSAEDVARTQAARAAEAAEKAAWEGFVLRAKTGRVAEEDRRYLREVEDLALGRIDHSRVLRALGREDAAENAHAALLEFGVWNETVNPYPRRLGLNLAPPATPLPAEVDDPGYFRRDDARRDLTHLPAYAIDDAWTETPDDALSVELLGDGRARLWVHVADPASLVPPGSPLDMEARTRGVTLHMPEGVVPMLPPATTPLLGLGLAEVSPALSFGLDVTEQGEIGQVEIVPSLVRVTRLTYEQTEAVLDAEPFATMARLAGAHARLRHANGAIEIDLPEASVRVRDGEPVITPVLPLCSRTLVEHAMVLAGDAVARFASEHAIPLPYATQEAPDGPPLGEAATPSEMYALRRTMKRSQYRSVPAAHSGLGLPAYAQATSPLRRYLDLVVHQQLRAYLAGATLLTEADILERIADVEPALAATRQAESLSNRHWVLVYLLRHPGWRGKAILVERRGGMNGVLIIPALALETHLHLPADLPLDSEMNVTFRSVDLPWQDVRFRVEAEGR
jgi:exoribonuclease II